MAGQLLVPETFGTNAVREPVHVQRSPRQVGDEGRGDLRRVPHEVPFGDRLLAPTWWEEDLVEVRQPYVATEHLPPTGRADAVEGAELGPRHRLERRRVERDRGLRGRQIRAPQAVGVGLDLVVGAAGQDRTRMLLRVPSGHDELVLLVQQQPALLARVVHRRPDEDELPLQLLAVQLHVELAVAHRVDRVAALALVVVVPGAGVPHDDVAAAVLARGDDALEVVVLQRVVLDVERRAAYRRVERGALRDGPAGEDPAHLQTEVVVQPAGPVPLHDEPAPGRQ